MCIDRGLYTICIEKGGVGLLAPKEQAFRPTEL